MGTRLRSLGAQWVLAVPAVFIGCNAILDNPVGGLDAVGGSVSVGGHTGNTGGGSALGGSAGTLVVSSVGGSATLGGATSSGGTASSVGSQAIGGATSTGVSSAIGGDSTSGGAVSVGGNSATGSNPNVGGFGQGGVGTTGGSVPIFGGSTATSATTTGGAGAIGGALGTGGENVSGTTTVPGTAASGGAATIGGGPGSGGTENGGAPNTGGAATGGVPATGGAATGGVPATGGASSIVGPGVAFSFATVNDAASTNLTTATFQFSSVPAGAAASFMCKLNGAAAFTDCTSGLALSQLSSGGQILTVHALDTGGHAGPDTTRSWTISALSTTIKTIRAGTYDDYLVSVGTGVRVTGFGTESAQQVIFVQEAGPATVFRVDALADIAGNTVLNSGILTRALTTQATKAEGAPVTVIGTVTHNGSSLELVRATYIWGPGAAIPYLVPQVRTSAVYTAGLEGIRIELDGRIPSSNCSSSCFNSLLGTSSKCIETVCVDSGCGTNKILSWLDISGGASPPVTTDYGAWMGWLVKRNSYYELWTNSSDNNAGSDVCM